MLIILCSFSLKKPLRSMFWSMLMTWLSHVMTVTLKSFKGYLSTCFHIKDLCTLKYFFGIEVVQNPKGIFLSQIKYSLDIISKTDLLGAKPSFFLNGTKSQTCSCWRRVAQRPKTLYTVDWEAYLLICYTFRSCIVCSCAFSIYAFTTTGTLAGCPTSGSLFERIYGERSTSLCQ